MPCIRNVIVVALLFFPGVGPPAHAALGPDDAPSPEAIGDLSIDELMKLKVTTATRQAQAVEDIPAAISVLTGEEIRRSGARTLMDALRLVPGVTVVRVDATRWSISIRGFGHRYSNKLLVLVDGRSVYSPLLNGVFWELHDIAPETIDRIEVVRGPGGSMWGANAVNGVINILTKNARDTQGLEVSAAAGNQESGSGDVRYGGALDRGGHFRIGARYRTQGSFASATGGGSNRDGSRLLRVSGRADWEQADGRFTLLAEALDGEIENVENRVTFTPPYSERIVGKHPQSAWFVLGKWERPDRRGGQTAVQAYAEHNQFNASYAREKRDTMDLEVQHRLPSCGPHALLVGANVRNTSYSAPTLRNGRPVISPTAGTRKTVGLFLHDEIALRQDLRLTLGARFDINDFTGWEVQPNARLLWKANERTTWWGSIARAVRTPTPSDRGSYISTSVVGIQSGLPVVATLLGDPNAPAETMVSHEIGVRRRFSDALAADLVGYFATYDKLRALPVGTPFLETAPSPHFVLPTGFRYERRGEAWGAELSAQYRPSRRVRFRAGYAFFDSRIAGGGPEDESAGAPHHWGFVAGSWDLGRGWTLDASLDAFDRPILANDAVAGHARLDLRLGWQPSPRFEISLAGQNVLTSRRLEYRQLDFVPGALVERAVVLQVRWRP